MRRRAPGHAAASPLRRWPGVVAVGLVVLLCSLAAGGVASAVAGVAASATHTEPGTPVDAPGRARAVAAVTTTAPAVTDDDAGSDSDADDAGTPYAVETSTVTVTDEARGRRFAVTLRLPVTDDPVPVVILVHGYAASAADYSALADILATAGFAVVSPDFPVSSTAATSSPARDIVAQAADVSFVLDVLLDGTTLPGVTPRLDGTRIAVVGHSDGGVTAAGVAFNDAAADPRVGAAVVLSGGAFGFAGSWFADDTPPALLVVHGTADTVNPFAAATSLFDQATGTKWLVAVEWGDHAGPFTDGTAVGDVGALVATFLAATIGGEPTAAAALPGAADAADLTLVAAA